MNTLPLDLYKSILPHLSIDQLMNLSQTNQKYQNISEDNQIWSALLKRDFNMQSENPKCEYIHLYKLSKLKTYIYTNINARLHNFGQSFAINAANYKAVQRIIYDKYLNNQLPDFLKKFIHNMFFPRYPQPLTDDDKEMIEDDQDEGYYPIPNMNTPWSIVFSFLTDEELMNGTGDLILTIQKGIF